VQRDTSASRLSRGTLGLLGPVGIVFMVNEAIGTASPGLLSIVLVFIWVGLTATAMSALAFRAQTAPVAARDGSVANA